MRLAICPVLFSPIRPLSAIYPLGPLLLWVLIGDLVQNGPDLTDLAVRLGSYLPANTLLKEN